MATSLYKLEEALSRKFTGKVLKNVDDSDNYVPVFVDYPDFQDAPERRFPSVGILMTSMVPQVDMYDSQPNYVLYRDDTFTPSTVVTRRVPEYYSIMYEVSCFSLSAFEDRELLRWCESRFAPRDYIEVDGIKYHVFREGFSIDDDIDFDTIIYKKTWTFSIIADIEDTDNDDKSKAVNQIKLKSNVVKSDSTTKDAKKVDKTLHREIVFDDQKYWFNSK